MDPCSGMENFIKNLFEPTVRKRTLFFLVFDFLLIELAVYLAFLLRLEGQIIQEQLRNIFLLFALAPFFVIPLLWLQRIYWMSWSYVSLVDFTNLIKSISISFLAIGLLIFAARDSVFSGYFQIFPRSTLFISFVLTVFFLGGLRAFKRVYGQVFHGHYSSSGEKIIIVGAGDIAEQVLRSIMNRRADSPYIPIGFVDDDPLKLGSSIHGCPIIGRTKDIPKIVKNKGVGGAIIALPSFGSRDIKRAVEACRKAKIKEIKIVPSFHELISKDITLKDLREIQIEDLLGRDPVKLDTDAIARFIRGKCVLITGAAGSVGSELSRQIARFNPRHLLLLDREETNLFYLGEEFQREYTDTSTSTIIADIKNRKKIEDVFRRWEPEIIFHAAAYKHVPVMEAHPDEAITNNILGTLIVGEVAISRKAEKFVFISTDKAVNPVSIMGRTKRIAETLCALLNSRSSTDFVSVRFGNVLESRGSVVSIFKEQIQRGGPVTITDSRMKRYFMAPSEAALLVTQAGAIGIGGKIYMLDMGEPIGIESLAREMIKLSGHEPDVDIPIVFTKSRPGEKFFEELFEKDYEDVKETRYLKIFEVSRNSSDEKIDPNFINNLNELFELSNNGSIKKMLEKLENMSVYV